MQVISMDWGLCQYQIINEYRTLVQRQVAGESQSNWLETFPFIILFKWEFHIDHSGFELGLLL
jgi:hypothetical protein